MTKSRLTIEQLKREAGVFAQIESTHKEPSLYGTTDGKAVGTYLEHKFREYLELRNTFISGNSAKGIDFPSLNVDMKVTSIRQPQSSCPFKSARQKIFGLGYALLVFVYDKTDDEADKTGRLDIKHTIFVAASLTADYTMTRIIREHVANGANTDDLIAIMQDRNLPLDDLEAEKLAIELLENPPAQGYLTISNALQWRLQYSRVIEIADTVDGIQELR